MIRFSLFISVMSLLIELSVQAQHVQNIVRDRNQNAPSKKTPSCAKVRRDFDSCVRKNRMYDPKTGALYKGMAYDCEDFAFYCAETQADLKVFIYFCKEGDTELGHGVNFATCEEHGTVKNCVMEPQTGETINCWPAHLGTSPPEGYNQSSLCKAMGAPKGIFVESKILPKGENPDDDIPARQCSDKHEKYGSCERCCYQELVNDGRSYHSNLDWLRRCKFFCWGKPGTGAKPFEVPPKITR